MIISIANQKGGVGKTTTAINLGVFLANFGKKVLLIDLDPQSNLTSGLGFNLSVNNNQITQTIYNVLNNEKSISEILQKTKYNNLFIVPSHIDLAGAEVELVSVLSRETILKNALVKVSDDFDYILIDCPPSLGILTINALVASDEIIIPIQCEYFALEGLGKLINTINLVKKQLNTQLSIAGVVLTMFDTRTNLSKQVGEEIKKFFKEKVYKTIIPRNVRLSEAPSFGKAIIEYDKNSQGAIAYESLAREVINQT